MIAERHPTLLPLDSSTGETASTGQANGAPLVPPTDLRDKLDRINGYLSSPAKK
jgi:hypothetical protein